LITINLGDYRFGQLTPAAAIVARASAHDVGFEPREGYGPWSFDVAADGSIWLLDEVNTRLLAWQPDHPDAPRIVPLPYKAAEDFALGPDGTVYVAFKPSKPDTWKVYAIDAAGSVTWTMPQDHTEIFNTQLRIGPDGALYKVGAYAGAEVQTWTPLTTPEGSPLTAAQQLTRTTSTQPLPGGLTLAVAYPSAHEGRLTLATTSGTPVRIWRITAAVDVDLGSSMSTPVLFGDDLIVTVAPNRQAPSGFQFELLTLRLPPTGGIMARVTLDPRLFWADHITYLRVGPDGALYHLRSNPDTGISIARYSLAPSTPTTPTPTPTPTVEPSSVVSTTFGTSTATATSTPESTMAPVTSVGGDGGGGNPWVWGLAAAAVAAGVAWWQVRRPHR
jgi:hypothetical protein